MSNLSSYIFQCMVRVLMVIIVLPIHECAHGWVANKLGDPTAKNEGRLTLNPIKHLDPIGSIALVLTGFGWAKPVPVNAFYFKNRKAGMAITAAAGPVSNLLMAYIAYLLYKLGWYFFPDVAVLNMLLYAFSIIAQVSVTLAVFNLIPVPPLDGSRILGYFLPERIYFQIMQYERYIAIVLFLLMFSGVLSTPINAVSNWFFNLFEVLTGYVDLLAQAIL